MNKKINMKYSSSITDLCEVNSSFDKGILRVCYTGKNRNGSYISKETIKKSIPTIYNCPVVCNYDRETDTLGGHDVEVVSNADGNINIINVTTPVGVIPESANVWFDNYKEEDGTTHEYLFTEVLLWKRQEAYNKIKKDGITSHSMEINVKSGELENDTYYINDFEFNAFALIGVEPCFEGSALEVFAKDSFKQELSEMMKDLKEMFSSVNTSKEDDNINLNSDMKGGKEIVNEKLELANKYGIDVESLDFSIEDFSIEELTEKFKAIKDIKEEKSDKDKFALTQNMVDEITRILGAETVSTEYGDVPKYYYVDSDFETGEVYAWGRDDGLLYGFPFTVNGDSIAIDFVCKKRKKFSIVDFDGGDDTPFKQTADFVNDVMNKYSDIKSKFDEASKTIETMKCEIDTLSKFKSDTENEVAAKERNELFSKFADLEGIEAFETLKSDCMSYDMATLEEKCFAIRGRNTNTKSFSKEKTPKLIVEKEDKSDEPYGGIVIKYSKH